MKKEFIVTGMTCAACQANVTRCVSRIDGVSAVNVNLLSGQMTVEYDEQLTNDSAIASAVQAIGYGAAVKGGTSPKRDGLRTQWNERQQRTLDEISALKNRLISSLVLLVPLMYIAMGHMLGLPLPSFFGGTTGALLNAFTQLLIALPIIVINGKFFTVGYKALLRRAPNMDSLVAIGSTAALIYGIFSIYKMISALGAGDVEMVNHYAHQLYFEASAMILALVTVGKYLESRSKAKTSDALERLINLAPKTATVIRDGNEHTIPAEQLREGDIVIIRPGESIPADGKVIEGRGYCDQSAITGESIPIEKNVGDTVICATINRNGTFRFQTSKVGDDTTLAQIIRLVDEAGSTKAPIARLADKVSGIFVPIVLVIALVTAIIWLAVGKDFEFALSCAISVLVISCPCALGLATPVAIMVGTGKAAEHGILIKSAASLELLHKTDTVVLDKTGTITTGHPVVTDVITFNGIDEQSLIKTAAAIESGSEHPLAEAVVKHARSLNYAIPTVDEFEAVSGRGVRAKLNGAECLGGNVEFMRESNTLNNTENTEHFTQIEQHIDGLAKQGKTPLLFSLNSEIIGIIAVADAIRETSRAAINQLTKMGIDVVMLTGDNQVTAEAVRTQLGLNRAIAGVMPADKEACIRELQNNGHCVVMVGDGINDAPALTRADVGIAIGAGTDIAIQSADIVLMKDTLGDVVTAIELSRAVINNIKMNLFWAFFYNILGIPIAAGALYPLFQLRLSPMLGSLAMSLSSVCVVSNALRLRFFKPKSADATTLDKQTTIEQTKGTIEMKRTLFIEGMMCPHCQEHVRQALAGVDGVTEVTVDLEGGRATVTANDAVTDSALISAVTAANYKVTDCVSE